MVDDLDIMEIEDASFEEATQLVRDVLGGVVVIDEVSNPWSGMQT